MGTGEKNNYYYLKEGKAKPSFFHKHKSGQLYCYPFRDYTKRELPSKVIEKLRRKYPNLDHSGCHICPVLVLFNLKGEGKRYTQSVKYAQKLGVYPNESIVPYALNSEYQEISN